MAALNVDPGALRSTAMQAALVAAATVPPPRCAAGGPSARLAAAAASVGTSAVNETSTLSGVAASLRVRLAAAADAFDAAEASAAASFGGR